MPFPNEIDEFLNPTADSYQDEVPHAELHVLVNEAVIALQTKLGIDGSADTDSIDYRLALIEAMTFVNSVNGASGDVTLDTGDIADTVNKRYVTDADLANLANLSGVNTGDQDLSGYFLLDGDNSITGDSDFSGSVLFREPVQFQSTVEFNSPIFLAGINTRQFAVQDDAGPTDYFYVNTDTGDANHGVFARRLRVDAGIAGDDEAALHFNTQANPGTPVDGDIWFDGTNFNFREDGSTKQLGSGGSGLTLPQTLRLASLRP